MRRFFADTSYYAALLNQRDTWHPAAWKITEDTSHLLMTTDWVLLEVANAFSRTRYREVTIGLIQDLLMDQRVIIVPATRESFMRGFGLYSNRKDKGWSLTDCISFMVMRDHELTEALTADRHFQQAGFRALLLETDPSE